MSNVVALLNRELELLSGFILLLEEEQDALKLGITESLPTLAEHKKQAIDALNILDAELRQTVGNIPTDGKMPVCDWAISQDQRNEATPLWHSLLEKARRAKQLNTLNTQLVDMHLRNTRELLSSLIPTVDSGPLYGSNGQANGNTGSRIIDSA